MALPANIEKLKEAMNKDDFDRVYDKFEELSKKYKTIKTIKAPYALAYMHTFGHYKHLLNSKNKSQPKVRKEQTDDDSTFFL